MVSIVVRTSIMFFLVMFSLRIMGKKNLGEFQPSDFVSTMLISNLTSKEIDNIAGAVILYSRELTLKTNSPFSKTTNVK